MTYKKMIEKMAEVGVYRELKKVSENLFPNVENVNVRISDDIMCFTCDVKVYTLDSYISHDYKISGYVDEYAIHITCVSYTRYRSDENGYREKMYFVHGDELKEFKYDR